MKPAGAHIAPTGCLCLSAEPAGDHIAPTGVQIAPTGGHCPSAEPAGDHIAPTGGHRTPTGDQIAPTGAHIAPTGDHIAPTGARKSRFRMANSTLRTNAIMPISRAAFSVQASVSGRAKPYPSRPRSYKLRCRIASSPIKSQRRSTRLRCDSIRFLMASIASHRTRYTIR